MRSIDKRWQDKRPGWTRRVTWYEGNSEFQPIRLTFEDANGRGNRVYGMEEREVAQRDFDAFKTGALTVLDVQSKTIFT